MPITQIDSSSTAIRNRILDAAVACLSDFGHARTTMQEIATRSGLSRRWVYKQFNNRNDVLAAVLRRELASFYGDLKIKLDVQSKTDELIVEIIVGFVDLSRNNQLFIRLWTLERDLVISWMTVESEFLLRTS
ncbi:TetR/AcrR family transcriptional regulator [Aliihoeflea sp. 2WW]|uniref:TetR/AcrR family transcriptional regulator n=1 Tax=Aliihoeflea sp. 2WW TaxID=1381123 RepID=UPI0009DFDF17|nr:TetR/AcrR family transcriptional regulator [Aliihoeflea sp. 2WW]